MSGNDPYSYPGTNVLINRLGITDSVELDRVERRLATARAEDGVPQGDFDLQHMKAIHRHLIQDIYRWAGEVRTIEIAKGGNQFILRRYVERGMDDIHARLVRDGFLRDLGETEFAEAAAVVVADLNYVHPFREGNGRTQLRYLEQLADRAGYAIDLERIEGAAWIAASDASFRGKRGLMTAQIRAAMRVGAPPAARP